MLLRIGDGRVQACWIVRVLASRNRCLFDERVVDEGHATGRAPSEPAPPLECLSVGTFTDGEAQSACNTRRMCVLPEPWDDKGPHSAPDDLRQGDPAQAVGDGAGHIARRALG